MLGSSVSGAATCRPAGPTPAGRRPAVTVTGLTRRAPARRELRRSPGARSSASPGCPAAAMRTSRTCSPARSRPPPASCAPTRQRCSLARASVAACLRAGRGPGARTPRPRRPRLRAQRGRQHQPARLRQPRSALVRRPGAGSRRTPKPLRATLGIRPRTPLDP